MAVTSRLKPLAVTSSLGNWTGFANVTESGAGNATATSTFANAFLGTYDFSELPEGALITGIDVSIRYLNLTENGSTTIRTNLYKGNTSSPDAKSPISYSFVADENNESTQNYGGEGDLWGYENVTKADISDLWVSLVWSNNTDNDTIAINGTSTTRPTVRIFYQEPRWAKVHTSGSALEVTSITASDIPNNGTANAEAVFISPKGVFQSTSSIQRRSISISDPFNNATELDKILDFNYSTYSISIPDSPVSASFITNSIKSDPNSQIISSAILFTDTTGGLEYSSSFFVEPVLSYEGSQSAIRNIELGGFIENDPDVGPTLSYPVEVPNTNQLGNSVGFGFNGDKLANPPYNFTSSATNYVNWLNRRYIEVLRTAPAGMYITCSYSIPYVYDGLLSAPSGREISIYLVVYVTPQDYDADAPLDVGVVTLNLNDLGISSSPSSGSITGSFFIDDDYSIPSLHQPDRWQIRALASTNGFHLGYDTASGDGTAAGTGQEHAKFQFEGQTEGVLNSSLILGAAISGTFIGDQFGNYSGSLSGITLNSTPISKAVIAGNGISFKWGSITTTYWKGSRPVTASVVLYNKSIALTGDNSSGLRFSVGTSNPPDPFQENPILLTGSLAGNGLDFGNAGTVISRIDVGFGDGITAEEDGLKISSTADGDGLVFFSEKISASLFPLRGLEISDNKLRLASTLAGQGLVWNTNFGIGRYNILDIDYNYVLTPDKSLQIKSDSDSIFYQINGVGPVTTPSMSYSGSTLNMTYNTNAHSTLASISGSTLNITGNLDLGNSVLVDKVQIKSDFVSNNNAFFTVNAGNPAISPFIRARGGIGIQTPNTDSASAIFYDRGTSAPGYARFDSRSLRVGGWQVVTSSVLGKDNDNPWTVSSVLSTPTASFQSSSFGATIQTVKYGSVSNPNSGQSSTQQTSSANVNASVFQSSSVLTPRESGLPLGGAIQYATSSFAAGSATLSSYTPNIPGGAIFKGVQVQLYAFSLNPGITLTTSIGWGSSPVYYQIDSRELSTTAGSLIIIGGNGRKFGIPENRFSYGFNADMNIINLRLSFTGGGGGNKIYLGGRYFSSTIEYPGVKIYYNTPAQENDIFYSTSSFSNYGAMYVNTTGKAWIYVPD